MRLLLNHYPKSRLPLLSFYVKKTNPNNNNMKFLIFTFLISLTTSFPPHENAFTSEPTNSQSREADYIYKLHADLFKLNEDPDFVINNILPEVYSQRDLIAPNYPVRNSGSSDKIVVLIDQWITDYPLEHENYKSFLENYIRTYPE